MWVQTVAKWPPARVAIQPPRVEYSNDCGKWRRVSAVLGELLVERRAEDARLDPRRARDRVDLEHPVERARGRRSPRRA